MRRSTLARGYGGDPCEAHIERDAHARSDVEGETRVDWQLEPRRGVAPSTRARADLDRADAGRAQRCAETERIEDGIACRAAVGRAELEIGSTGKADAIAVDETPGQSDLAHVQKGRAGR